MNDTNIKKWTLKYKGKSGKTHKYKKRQVIKRENEDERNKCGEQVFLFVWTDKMTSTQQQ